MNIGVTGHQGMLGQAVSLEVIQQGHVLRTWDDYSSVMLPPRARRLVSLSSTDLAEVDALINCAGIVSQQTASDQELVWNNSYSPQYLASLCDRTRTRLIQVSTDCVFSLPGPHTEASPLSPHGMYALSKAAGEVLRAPHLTLRTSFVGYGAHGLLTDMREQASLAASRRLLWSGHTAPTVAAYLVRLAAYPDITGLLHLPGEWQNRYELCLKLKTHTNLPVEIREDNSFTADRRLLSTRWHRLPFPDLPAFDQELADL